MTSEKAGFQAPRFSVLATWGVISACRATSTAIGHGDAGVHADPPTTLAARPPYDLDADVRTRIDGARMRFGPAVHVAMVGDAFVLIAADPAVSLDAAASFGRQALAAYVHDRFAKSPDRAVSVLLFNGASNYGAYCRKELGAACDEDLGAYSVLESVILVNAAPGLGTLTHEMVHPFVQHDFPLAPQWLNEGVASLFEAPVFPSPGEIHGAPNWRMPILARPFSSLRRGPRVLRMARRTGRALALLSRMERWISARPGRPERLPIGRAPLARGGQRRVAPMGARQEPRAREVDEKRTRGIAMHPRPIGTSGGEIAMHPRPIGIAGAEIAMHPRPIAIVVPEIAIGPRCNAIGWRC